MADEAKDNVTFEVRVTPGCSGVDPEAPDWEIVELVNGEVASEAEVYDHLTLAEANQIAAMWTRKKEEAGL